MNRRKRHYAYLSIFIISCITLGAYLQVGILPGQLRTYAIENIQKAFHKRILFEKALYLPFQGLTLERVQVFDEDGSPLFCANKLAFDIKIIPFFKQKKIIVRNLLLDSPIIDYYTENEKIAPSTPVQKTVISGQVAIPAIPENKQYEVKDLSSGPDIFIPENVYLEQVEIQDARITIRPSYDAPITEIIEPLNLRMRFHKPPVLSIDGSFSLGDKKSYLSASLRGSWNLKTATYDFLAHVKSDRVPQWLRQFQKNNLIKMDQGKFSFDARLRSITEERVVFASLVTLRDTQFLAKDSKIAGNATLRAEGVFNFLTKQFERYRGNFALNKLEMRNLSPSLPLVTIQSGLGYFDPNGLRIDSLAGRYQNLNFTAKAAISNFSSPYLKGQIQTSQEISSLIAFLPKEQKKLIAGFAIGGDCYAITNIEGPLSNPTALKMGYLLRVQNGFLTDRRGFQIREFSGDIIADPTVFRIERSSFRMANNERYALDLTLPHETDKAGQITLQNRLFKAQGTYLLRWPAATIRDLKLTMQGVSLNALGNISDLSRGNFQLEGKIAVELEKALKQLQNSPLDNLRLRGLLDGVFTAQGRWDKLLETDLRIDGQSPAIYIYQNMPLDDFEIQIRLKNSKLNIPYLHAKPFGGVLGAKVAMDLGSKNSVFDANVYAHRINLKLLAPHLSHESSDIQGALSLAVNLRGDVSRPETYRGSGTITIDRGRLWQTDLFGQMGQLPFVQVEGLDHVTFNDMSGAFSIHDSRIWTEDLSLRSQTVSLTLKGSMRFDQRLDFLMSIRYSGDVMRGADDAGGLAPFMVRMAQNNIPLYRIRGSLATPIYEKA